MKITPEMKKKLKSFSVASNGIIVEFTPTVEADIPIEYVPTFTLKTLSVAEVKQIKNISVDVNTEDFYNEIIRSHVIGWKNLYDISDDPTPVVYVSDEMGGIDKKVYENLFPESLKVLLTQSLITLSMA